MSNVTTITKQTEQDLIQVLQNSLYPGAAIGSVQMVLNYCMAAGLDPMQKPVHIVPIWDAKSKQMRDVVMPGIGLYRTQAARSGNYAGVSEAEYGPDTTEKLGGVEITYPAWCRVTVKRLLPNGQIAEFSATERWKENYAVKGGQEKSIAPNAMWQKRPYAQLAKCFDPETEVLTTKGFERFDSVTGQILQVTSAGLSPCDALPFVQDYDGEMIVADGSRLNFSVTPNHDMLTVQGKIEAGDLFDQATKDASKWAIPRAPQSTRPDVQVPDGAIQLAGYFLADGSHTGHHQFRVAVSRPYKVESLRALMLHERESVKADAGRVAAMGERAIVTNSDKVCFTYQFGLISWLVNSDKSIKPDQLLNLSMRQARILVDAMIEFDGSDPGSSTRRFHQTNCNVLEAFEVAAVHAGLSVSARSPRNDDSGGMTVAVSEAVNFPVVRGVEKNKGSLVKRRNVAGKVWCVTVPSSVIVVRRGGFSMLCHQCAEAQALRKAFPEFGSAATADEMEGKEIDMGAAEVVQSPARGEPTELPPYPPTEFAKNLELWGSAIAAGKAKPEQIVSRSSTKYTLTEEQIAAIYDLDKPAHVDSDGVIDADFVREFDGAQQ